MYPDIHLKVENTSRITEIEILCPISVKKSVKYIKNYRIRNYEENDLLKNKNQRK